MRRLDELGHEVTLHGGQHVDNYRFTMAEFRTMIRDSRRLLEDIVGEAMVGYRAPQVLRQIRQHERRANDALLPVGTRSRRPCAVS